MKKKTLTSLISMTLAVSMAFGMAGCSKKEEEPTEEPVVTVTSESEPEVTPEAEPDAMEAEAVVSDLPAGKMYSYLTGEVVDEEFGTQRPYAVMINNLQPAVPQSGTSNAEILYECQVEGNITRLMAIIQDPTAVEKIGPIRSARHYYIDFAQDNQAIFTHFGWSIFAEDRIVSNNLEHVNGMDHDGDGKFFRSSDRVAPHNAYVTGVGLVEESESLGISRDYKDGYLPNLAFNKEDTPLTEGTEHTKVFVPFTINNPYFEYHEDDGLYYRFEYGSEHLDMENDEQLKFKNIIVQFVEHSVISDEDHQDLNLYTEGNGLYITDGKAVEITWRKTGADDATKYYDSEGNQLKLNPGKSMIEVVPNDRTVTFE